MLSHAAIWAAIDRLAARHGLTASGLARRAGLDPTTFNRSKRVAADGRPRWPSTESIAKILDVTGEEMARFIEAAAPPALRRVVPRIGFAEAGSGGYFDDSGFPAGEGWEEVEFPGSRDGNAYALTVSGDSMLPLYRPGDTIVVSPAARCAVGDRVVAKTRSGEVMVKVLKRRTAKLVELQSLNPAHPDRVLPAGEVEWIARIVWASQ
ncbi:MAG: helix-turn-helix transcriptional regulator [Bauldia sp.]|nr:helix-turn-helix transcriptional regulator [Bauldia sp.]